jgi:hypothetical protein
MDEERETSPADAKPVRIETRCGPQRPHGGADDPRKMKVTKVTKKRRLRL